MLKEKQGKPEIHLMKMATSALATPSKTESNQSPQHQTPTKVSPSSATSTAIVSQQQSPRNTGGGTTALPSGTCLSFGPVDVSKSMQDGEKFVKWDEVRHFHNIFQFFCGIFDSIFFARRRENH